MVNLPTEWRKKERSFSDHSKILHHCDKMLRSLSNRSSSSINNQLNASTNEIPPSPHRSHQSIKKAFSLILNKTHFKICNPPDDCEMHEFIRYTSSEENLNTIQRSESTISGDAITNQQPLSVHSTCPTTHRHCISMHRTLSHIKNKIRSSSRHEHTTDDSEKNNGYLVVENPDSELVLLPDNNLDRQETRHAQPCVQINEDSFDLDQIQYTSATSVIPNLSPSQRPFLGLSRMLDNQSNNEFQLQSTRSSVECGVPQSDFVNIHETQLPQAISTTTSPSSTNSSYHEYTGVDRPILDDDEYVRAQQLDLEHLTILDIKLSEERSSLKAELDFGLEFNVLYDEALKRNSNLKEELRTLQEEYDHIYSPWSCQICTLINRSYSDTFCDICEVCESPSPLKRATLIK